MVFKTILQEKARAKEKEKIKQVK